jgi:2-C-methyl-D-erythritol 4-phosphate cytidylyltransferase
MQHITDDLQLLELAGEPTWLVPGDDRNIKITTPQDLVWAETLLARR